MSMGEGRVLTVPERPGANLTPPIGPLGRSPTMVLVATIILAICFLGSLFINSASVGTVVLAFVLAAFIMGFGRRLSRPEDAHWLPMVIAAGFLAKLIASGGRFWVLTNLYHGVGDASGYHNKALNLADTWRSLTVPPFGTGTDFVPPVTGLLYVPYKPTMLGGFFIFATLAFFGQLLMVFGFRHVSSPRRFKWYVAAILFSPTILYWPSSIGKESLMFLFLGPAAYGAARLLSEYRFRWAIPIGIGLILAAVLRAHVALLFAGALVVAVTVAVSPPVQARMAKRVIMIGVCLAALFGSLLAASQRFNLDLTAGVSADLVTEEIDPFLADVSDRTAQGGSEVEGGFITNPAQLPEAVLTVLFRPLPWEATSVQTLAASLEGGLLLALFLVRAPAMVVSIFRIRRQPYAFFSVVFTLGFVLAFSAMLNLGILARQRSQAMPFLFAFLILCGFREAPALPAKEMRPPVGDVALVR